MSINCLFYLLFILVSCKSKDDNKIELHKKSQFNIDSINKVIHEKDSLITTFQNQYYQLYESCRKENQNIENQLYSNSKPITIQNTELISFANSTSKATIFSDEEGYYTIRVISNGPSDDELPYCNTSDQIYIATCSGEDLPHFEYLYKLGPYMECTIEKIDQKNRKIYFNHLVKNKRISQIAEFSLTTVKILK
jgi:hypothetical protein